MEEIKIDDLFRLHHGRHVGRQKLCQPSRTGRPGFDSLPLEASPVLGLWPGPTSTNNLANSGEKCSATWLILMHFSKVQPGLNLIKLFTVAVYEFWYWARVFVRLGWKSLPRTNALAYFEIINYGQKCFITLVICNNVIRLSFLHNLQVDKIS